MSALSADFTPEGAQAFFDYHQQQNEPEQSQQQLGSPETMELLTSILAAVEAQNTRIATLTEQQKKLAGFVKVMDEETMRRLERITAPASTSSPSSDVSARIASIESRQNEIASTLGEFAQSLNGESLNAASRSLVAEAQKNRAATASAIEGLKAQVTANQKLVSQVGGAVQRIEKRTEERVGKAVEQVAGKALATMTASLDASNARAERIIAATAKLEARQLWSTAAAMCLVLLPVAVVVAGLWMGIAGLITGVQWALDVDGSVWLGIGRWPWSSLASPGPATGSSRPSGGPPVSRRRGRAAGCRRGRAGARGDRDSRGQARGARVAAPATGLLVSYHCIVQCMLTIASRLDVMNRLGRAMADPTRSRILMSLLDGPSHPAVLSRELGLTRSNVSNHLTCLRDCGIVVAEPEGRQTRYEIADPHLAAALTALVDVTLAVDESAPCIDPACSVPGCCAASSSGGAS